MEPSTELFTESSVKTFTESSTHFPEECDYNIQQLKIENKCKKTVTVTAINSPLNIWVVMDDTEKNVSYFILFKFNDGITFLIRLRVIFDRFSYYINLVL